MSQSFSSRLLYIQLISRRIWIWNQFAQRSYQQLTATQFEMNKVQASKVKSLGEIPNARFGHTFTMVSKTKAVLFGGAISDNGKFVITNETYLYDFVTHRWKKLAFEGCQVPSERAAHASANIGELQMAVYGGAASGTQGLLKDDLYVLDLKKEPTWRTVQLANKQSTPGQRYGHSMVYSRPFLIIFGGNTGNKAENDVWLYNTSKSPSSWVKYDFENKPVPCPRVYHSAAICEVGAAQGMMVVFGGRRQTKKDSTGKQSVVPALNDIWGLRKHRDGTWDWVFPAKHKTFNPLPRYQHMICFTGPVMLIIGGRTNMPQQATSLIQAYNTETSQWYQMQAVSRYRHAIVTVENTLYIHGGFEPEFASHPLETMVSLEMPSFASIRAVAENEEPQTQQPQTQTQMQISSPSQDMMSSERSDRMLHSRGGTENTRGGENQGSRRELREIKDIRNLSSNNRAKAFQKNKERELTPSRILTSTKNIRLSNQAIVATGQNHNMQIQKVHVNTLLQQSKRLTQTPKLQQQAVTQPQLIQCFLSILLPTNAIPKSLNSALFPFKKQKIVRLCEDVCLLLSELPGSVVYLRAPVKIYGCLYGRYQELLRLFQNFGNPDEHQTETFDFVFLGNYVDKGYNSLETICLLLALKLKYPEHIVLLRGSHEDAKVNRLFGLAEECAVRLGENISDPNSVYNNLNRVFDLLPLAAVVQDKILCIHSGVGNIKTLGQLQAIDRPTTVQKHKSVVDVLWSSTYSDSRDVMNYNPTKSSQTTLNNFLEQNGLMMVVRSRECVPEGYQSDGNKINIFSVCNYGKTGGSAAILKITKGLDVVPFVLQPSNTTRGTWINQTPLKTGLLFTEEEQQLRKKMFSPLRKR